MDLADIARRFGTPAYVVDEDAVRARCREYLAALPSMTVAYAGKAFLTQAMATWVAEEGLSLDVCSGGELTLARSVGFPASRIIFHGNAKTPAELREAVGVGRIVIDNIAEIHRLAALVPLGLRQDVYLRVTPGVEAGGHAAIRTGSERQKFGIPPAELPDAVARVLSQPELRLAGLHCHIGSQITSVAPFETAARIMVDQLAMVQERFATTLPELDLGGGHGVAYLDDEHGLDLGHFGASVPKVVAERCRELRVPEPRLVVEPGRAIVAAAGVTLYRVISVKRQGGRTFVAVDGGMSDNPRPALYGARYSVSVPGRSGEPVTIVGRHCEAGDVLAEDVPAGDARPGDLVVVRVTGAYHHAMGSSYNLTCRPPVVAVRGGAARLIVRREEPADLMRRDVGR
ncbi:diaminopimelate decarboxylase [Herbidospora sp. NBRC 101105]|uniref:diaminopimelate decarboxylase n=1 Tax=Herbidospora sp. NBRC 101105 TaxID=3032195 RepID=UPI0024A14FE9|nr:diaminopimelate decarboxylase [Herbidospora sp. NBRC 101105]GLX98695.1 diaminopimelate decarboxylase [Herbidospora sp. NBRC 101105]